MFISNRGEYDVTFKINKERCTFPFLCSDQMSQQMIRGHNFSKAFHIGMLWNADDVMSLTRNGVPFGETLPTHNINALVFCMESTVILPYSNGYIWCRLLRERENCVLVGVVCLNPHSNTDLYTHTVIHTKDW